MRTPGPWTYTLEKRDKSWPGLYSLNTDLLEFGWDGEEGIYLNNPDDAALMFAAPELLSALIVAQDNLICLAPELFDDAEHHASWIRVLAQVAHAIAKAEGRA